MSSCHSEVNQSDKNPKQIKGCVDHIQQSVNTLIAIQMVCKNCHIEIYQRMANLELND